MTPHKTTLAEYRALETRVLASLREDLTDGEFNSLALDVHAFQRRQNEPYARWCASLPEPATWRDIPATPQAMFKRFRLSCFPPSQTTKLFRSSGTTAQTRSEHHLPDTKLYDAAILAGWKRLGLPRTRSIFLSPTPDAAPDSSLAHMFGTLARSGTGSAIFTLSAEAQFAELSRSEPLALFGTALAFVHLFEQMADHRVRLADGSFAIETGGFKGSRREVTKRDLYAQFERQLGLPPDRVWNEYGMCELGSQFYAHGLDRPHTGGPWVRALITDPDTGAEVAPGETGVLRFFDLANAGSVLAIQTADLATRREHGFELLGRDPAALARGCSITADEALRSGRGTGISQGIPTENQLRNRSCELHHTAIPAKIPLAKPVTAPPLPDISARAAGIANAAAAFPFLGEITAETLLSLVATELGHAEALERFVPRGLHCARAIAPCHILHVISGNTPAAALQTIIRGLLLGSHNLCKLPSAGLPEAEQFRALLPDALAARIEFARELPEQWLGLADAAVVFGRDETIATLRGSVRPGIPFLAHGHKLSFAVIFADPEFESVGPAARDVSVFDQQGCLSPHVVFILENGALTARAYAQRLATAMADFQAHTPRGPLTLSEANGIRTLREEIGFRAANGESLTLFASTDTAWTVIADSTPGFPDSPLNRVIFVKPLPADLAATVAPLRPHLSTCGVWPATPENAEFAAALGVTRVCPLGRMQLPPLTWHHDGQPVLAPLVRWVDFESA